MRFTILSCSLWSRSFSVVFLLDCLPGSKLESWEGVLEVIDVVRGLLIFGRSGAASILRGRDACLVIGVRTFEDILGVLGEKLVVLVTACFFSGTASFPVSICMCSFSGVWGRCFDGIIKISGGACAVLTVVSCDFRVVCLLRVSSLCCNSLKNLRCLAMFVSLVAVSLSNGGKSGVGGVTGFWKALVAGCVLEVTRCELIPGKRAVTLLQVGKDEIGPMITVKSQNALSMVQSKLEKKKKRT